MSQELDALIEMIQRLPDLTAITVKPKLYIALIHELSVTVTEFQRATVMGSFTLWLNPWEERYIIVEMQRPPTPVEPTYPTPAGEFAVC